MNFCGVLLLFQMLISLTLVLSSEDNSDSEYYSGNDDDNAPFVSVSETDPDPENISSPENIPDNINLSVPFTKPVFAVEFVPIFKPTSGVSSVPELEPSDSNKPAEIFPNILPAVEGIGYSDDTIGSETVQPDSEIVQPDSEIFQTEIPVENTMEESLNEEEFYFPRLSLAEAVLWRKEDDFVENFLNFPQRICNFIFTYLYFFSLFDHQYQY